MPSRVLPNLGLRGFYDVGENGWGAELSAGLLKLSVLVQGGVKSRVAAVPGAPAAGDVHILTAAPHAQTVAVFDDGEWVYYAPSEGWLLYDRGADVYVTYDGAAWEELATGTGDGGGDPGNGGGGGAPSETQAMVSFDGNPAVILKGYNIASVVRNSQGKYRVTFTTPFEDADYFVQGLGKFTPFNDVNWVAVGLDRQGEKTTTHCDLILTERLNSNLVDANAVVWFQQFDTATGTGGGGGGGGGGVPVQRSAQYWGLANFRNAPNTDAASMSKIVFMANGVALPTPTVVRSIDSSNAIANAFDNDPNSFWSTYNSYETFAVLDFGAPVAIDQIAITCRSDNDAQVPTRFDVFAGDLPEQMDHAITVFCGDAWPSGGSTATFDVPEVAVGGGGGGLEDAPEDGKVYGRQDGEWVEAASGGSGGGGGTQIVGQPITYTGTQWGGETGNAGAVVPGTEFEFNVPEDGDYIVRYHIVYNNNHRVRGNIYMDGAPFATVSGTNDPTVWNASSRPLDVTGLFALDMESIGPLTAGAHTVSAFYNAMDATNEGGVQPGSYVTVTKVGAAFAGSPATGVPKIVQQGFARGNGGGNIDVVLPAPPTPGNHFVLIWSGAGGNMPTTTPSGFSVIEMAGLTDGGMDEYRYYRGHQFQGFSVMARRIEATDGAVLSVPKGTDWNNYWLLEVTPFDVPFAQIGRVVINGASDFIAKRFRPGYPALHLAVIEHDDVGLPVLVEGGETVHAFEGAGNHAAIAAVLPDNGGDLIGTIPGPNYPAMIYVSLAKYQPGGGGGGGGKPWYWDPPKVADFPVHVGPGFNTIVAMDDPDVGLLMSRQNNSNNRAGMMQAVPAGVSWTVTCRIENKMIRQGAAHAGLIVANLAQDAFVEWGNDSRDRMEFARFSNTGYAGYENPIGYMGDGAVWLRLFYDIGTGLIHYGYSAEGKIFSMLANYTIRDWYGADPAYVGLSLRNEGYDPPVVMSVQSFTVE